jgi:non-ribosomal peptide synthetase component F
MPKDKDRHNNLSRSMRDLGANTGFLTPSVATLLNPGETPLQKLILGGERVTSELVDKWADNLHLVACYGPAETCIYPSATPALARESNPANIGKPFGCHYWIVDVSTERLTPLGCVGELWIEGPILAKEYLNDPTRMASSLVTNPLWAKREGPSDTRRFYRTGDLVRYADDGSLLFIAKKDTQVKVNGNGAFCQ